MQINHKERGCERKSSNVPDSTQECQVLGETVVTYFPRLQYPANLGFGKILGRAKLIV